MSIDLTGKTALITGASRGIGEAAARILAGYGANVVLAARSTADCERIAAEIGDKALAVACDVARYSHVDSAVSKAVSHFGSLDILVNNAGLIDPIARIEDSDPDAWGQVVDVNFKGVYHGLRAAIPVMKQQGGGVICFTPGTMIRTGDGAQRIEDLREGDLVQTKDNGMQPVRWIGKRRMSGARLFAMPHLRPVRFRADALGLARPDQDLLVSPSHRLLIKGNVAQDLFNAPEVLVTAKDLINGRTITVDLQVPKTTYVHLMLPCHEILWANGVETESFHPANTALTTLASDDRARLLERFPDLDYDPHIYGRFARRNLSASEAAILRHAA